MESVIVPSVVVQPASPIPHLPASACIVRSFSIELHQKADGSHIRLFVIHDAAFCHRLRQKAPLSLFPWRLDQILQSIEHSPNFGQLLTALDHEIWKSLKSDLEDIPIENDLHKEFHNGWYSVAGITICYNVFTLSKGYPVHIVKDGAIRVVSLEGLRDNVDARTLTLIFYDGSSMELAHDRLPFTDEAGLWLDHPELLDRLSLPVNWFPSPPGHQDNRLEQQAD
jgi:hypothetical protein